MGQYYRAYNIDKKEAVDPFEYKGGAKLLESCYVGNAFNSVICTLLGDRWNGDRVILIGDYAWNDAVECGASGAELLACYKSEGVLTSDPYCVQESAFQHVPVSEFANYRFIVNLDENVYIDREKLPVAWTYTDDEGADHEVLQDAMHLFLAVGNGLGCGDYHSECGKEYVGFWAGDHIRATNDRPEQMKEVESPFDARV